MPAARKKGKGAADEQAGLAKSQGRLLDLVGWGKELIRDLSGHIPAEEEAFIAAQVHALGRDNPARPNLPPDPTSPTIVNNRNVLKTLAAKMADADDIVLDLETSDLDPRKGVVVGAGLAIADATYYLPINHCFEESGALRPGQLTLLDVLRVLPLQKPFINHNVKFEMRWLHYHGRVNCRFVWDTMIAARLLRSDLPSDLETVAMREFDVPAWGMPQADIKRVRFVPIERVASYCAKDCWYTLSLYREQRACMN